MTKRRTPPPPSKKAPKTLPNPPVETKAGARRVPPVSHEQALKDGLPPVPPLDAELIAKQKAERAALLALISGTPAEGHTRWGRSVSRSEVRSEALGILFHDILPLLGIAGRKTLEKAVANWTEDGLDIKALQAFTNLGQLLASMSVGSVGANQVDPQDVAKLPPPVFQTVDPSLPLPNGKPDA